MKWFTSNGLSLNASKTQNLNFSLRKVPGILPTDASAQFLGVHLDPGLTWREHVAHLTARLSSIVYLMRNLSRVVSHSTLMSAYHGYFSSSMNYALLNWGHSAHAKEVFGLQRRCIRIIAGLGYRDCCRCCFTSLGVLTLPCTYILLCLMHIKLNQHLFTEHKCMHNYPTRGGSNIVPEFFRLGKARTGTTYFGVRFFNVLPLAFRGLAAEQFRKGMRRYLVAKAFYSFAEYLDNDFSDLT